ncbi:type II toxin-antitoxin system RelE/ParE family toxin [Arvimicrobium flavum]|uniref:type II toxin-antitoxin system RelE/ParE family toxin n=1 Tax=Arvimicrobium flavum TaxID=3393320 RepID=UPI00237A3015|nr:type II toxin-antitoxin system RelE/ParE family toxin [Mesorhizobium shangrilense]
MRIRWTPEAEADRLEIFEYVAAHDPAAADRLNATFDRAIDRIRRFPLSAREGKLIGSRELIPHPSYRIVYEIRSDTIWIAAIFHTARRWPPIAGEDA